MAGLRRLFQCLQDPQLVASFQKCCGLFLEFEDRSVAKSGQLNGSPQHSYGPSADKTEDFKNGMHVARLGVTCSSECNGTVRYRSHGSTQYSNGIYQNHVTELPVRISTQRYVVKNYFFYYLFQFAAALGNEIFYITFLPCTYWNFDPYVSRRLVYVWAIVMYIGQASKDILKLPRPCCPPVVKLETRVDAEYGMPSTHAMAATAISFTTLLSTLYRYKYPFEYGLMAALVLSCLVSLSRLYTGMHTVLDVICGVLGSGIIMAFTYPVWDIIDHLQLVSCYTPVFALVVPFLMSYNYPELDHYSTTRADTTTILGVASGSVLGFWLNYQFGRTYEPTGVLPFSIPQVTPAIVLVAVGRFVIGIVILLTTRQVVKGASLYYLCAWHKVSIKDEDARQRLEIEVPYKFLTYSAIGFNATVVVPYAFQIFGLL
ncbi:sphingosine-1-phosphate phosphatase 2 [Protopterus annectens]|uniref:sphingosine-1-phosphate phosphatase 2 n=1 Tax=Protopterus annectens TaxID=7888 RepID=UPI001CFAD8E2|nr:sphingosine-1-phosphate phosphatase 2 [Protopterus annectens]